MGYERNDRRYGNPGDRGYGADRGRDDDRFNDRGRSGGDPRDHDHQDRGFLDRAGDEVRSWFGDDEAERRREADDRYGRRDEERGYGERGRDQRGGDRDRGYGAAGSGDAGRGAAYYGAGDRDRGANHDPSYRSWRDRQMESFDRDYDEYRREHQSRFDSEFRTWRESRQGKRDLLGKVKEHFEVVGSDGQHVGTVDHVRGDRIELTRTDQDAGGRHHLIPSSWLQAVEDDKVMLDKTAAQAKQHWQDEARDAGAPGDRTLNRSFSGTY